MIRLSCSLLSPHVLKGTRDRWFHSLWSRLLKRLIIVESATAALIFPTTSSFAATRCRIWGLNMNQQVRAFQSYSAVSERL